MRSNGLATVLLMIPVLTVPALAIFGIPQFAPVVASPLDEGQDDERDPRGGSSARQSSRDDFFGEVEGFGDESDEEPAPKKRKSGQNNSRRRDSSRRLKEPDTAGWSDESMSSSEPTAKRRPSSIDSDELADQDSRPISKSTKRSSAIDKPPRDKQRSYQSGRSEEPIRLASAGDVDRELLQAGFDDDSQFEDAQPVAKESRSRGTGATASGADSRRSKRRESSEPLSWATAVERLNQLDVRNFRLEPGRQLGQFVFICVYTSPDNPSVMHRFEAEADQPLKAVENVLDQIVEWQQRR